ncbi:hypothetical protein [Vibrio gangliei]|uniref:hypothetical protein n=1 Tax=Vibrio gangliei TaxID=2077090 RepID=UPI000D01B1CF|nr:hypothetical protein [Vibrio gangliei]
MQNHQNVLVIKRSVLRFLVLAVVVALPVICIRVDIFYFNNNLGEISLTEFLQEGMLFIATCLFASIAKNNPDVRHAYVLIAGFFACLLIRELDALFDLIYHGFWVVPALVVAASAIRFALTDKEKTVAGLSQHAQDKNNSSMMVGLAVLLIFSRLFGMGSLWEGLLGDEFVRAVKNVAEEGTEVLGYALMFYSALCYYVDFKRVKSESLSHK